MIMLSMEKEEGSGNGDGGGGGKGRGGRKNISFFLLFSFFFPAFRVPCSVLRVPWSASRFFPCPVFGVARAMLSASFIPPGVEGGPRACWKFPCLPPLCFFFFFVLVFYFFFQAYCCMAFISSVIVA